MDWLYKPYATLEEHLRLVMRVAVGCFFYASIVISLLIASGVPTNDIHQSLFGIYTSYFSGTNISLNSHDIFVYAAIEEIFFRMILIGGAVWLLRRKEGTPDFANSVMIVMIFSSIWFGFAHGHWYNLFIQGVGGFFFALVYLKCGGLRRDYLTGCFWSTVTHAVYNSIIFYMGTLLLNK